MRVTKTQVEELGNTVAQKLNYYLKMAQAKQTNVLYPNGEYAYNIRDGLYIKKPNSTSVCSQIAETVGASIQAYDTLYIMNKTLNFVNSVVIGMQPTQYI